MITLRFVSHPGPFDLLVKAAQLGYWASHVDALLPDGNFISSRFWDGVQIRPPDYDAGKFSREQWFSIIATKDEEAKFYGFLHDQVGKPYDALAIVSFLFWRDWQAADSWFCSELPAAALSACGLFPKMLAVGFNRITPRDLALITSALVNEAGQDDR